MRKTKYTVSDIANWFIWKNRVEQLENVTEYDNYEVYEGLSHLKLQKLIYYAQGLYLAYTGNSLFKDKILAWEHGPVSPTLYQEYKIFGRNDIIKDFSKDELNIVSQIETDNKASEVLEFVYKNFGIYTAWQLRQISHIAGGPWEITVRTKGMDKEIDKKLMKDYFKRYIKKDA